MRKPTPNIRFYCFLLIIAFSVVPASAQTFTATQVESSNLNNLQVYQLDLADLHNYVDGIQHTFPLAINFDISKSWSMELEPHDLRTTTYQMRTAKGEILRTASSPVTTFKGKLVDQPDSEVRMTIKDNYVRAYIQAEDEPTYYIDMLDGASETGHVVVSKAVASDSVVGYCGASHEHQIGSLEDLKSGDHLKGMLQHQAPYETEIAFAVDRHVYEDFNTMEDLEAELLTILNYTDAYFEIHDLTYRLTEIFVATTEAEQPWKESGDAGDMLENFTDWAGGTGELLPHDVATLWTGVNFGSTIGIAWLNAIGSSFRQNVVNFQKSRDRRNANIHAHELGHNWGSDHVGSNGWMMSAFLTNADEEARWHDNTIAAFPGYVNNAMDHLDDLGGGSLVLDLSPIVIGEEVNNNNMLDPGETASLEIVIENMEDAPMENLLVTMTNDNNRAKTHVTINTDPISVNSLEAGASTTVSFNVTLSTDAPFDRSLRFLFEISDGTRTSESTASIVSGDELLPVDLVSFTAVETEAGVLLQWETASETNNAGFEIEQKFNAEPFETIQFVEGAGTTTETQNYNVLLDNLAPGDYAFRLRQIDFDGAFALSDEVHLQLLPRAYELAQNYPNPFNPQTHINFTIPAAREVSLEVFDVLGRRVAVLVNELLGAGQHSVLFDANDLPNGTYVYRLKAGVFEETKQMILMK